MINQVLGRISHIRISELSNYELRIVSHEQGESDQITIEGEEDEVTLAIDGQNLIIKGNTLENFTFGSIKVGYSSEEQSSSVIRAGDVTTKAIRITVSLEPNSLIDIKGPGQSVTITTPLSPKLWAKQVREQKIPELRQEMVEKERELRAKAVEKRTKYLAKSQAKLEKASAKRQKAKIKEAQGKASDARQALRDAQEAEREAEQYASQANKEYDEYITRANAVKPKFEKRIKSLLAAVAEIEKNN